MGEPVGSDRTPYDVDTTEITTLPPALLARLAAMASERATDAYLPFIPQQVHASL